MKQKVREILTNMVLRKQESFQKNTLSAPKHMPKSDPSAMQQLGKQETLWQ